MIISRLRILKEYAKKAEIPKRLELQESEIKQLYSVIEEGPDRVNGEFYALCLAYRAGFVAGRESCGNGG